MSIFEQKKNDVVTIAVITYHSAATVLETLDSIVNQSYGPENIELIISDDGSKDNTVQIIDDWLARHQAKFHNVKFFANEVNSGISKNCNVAWKAATSEWIKTIAGDDILRVNAIENYCCFISENPSTDVLFASMSHFKNNNTSDSINITPYADIKAFFELRPAEQHRFLLTNSFNMAPTSFIRTKVLMEVNYCNEDYFYIEDLPLWLKMTNHGYKLSYLGMITIDYRISDSLSNSIDRLVNHAFIKQQQYMYKREIWPYLSIKEYWRVIDKKIEFASWLIPVFIFNNKRNFFSLSLHYGISLFRPLALNRIYKRVLRACKLK